MLQLWHRCCSCVIGAAAVAWMLQLCYGCCSCGMDVLWVLQLWHGCCSCVMGAAAVAWMLQLCYGCCSCGMDAAAVLWVLQLWHGCCSCCLTITVNSVAGWVVYIARVRDDHTLPHVFLIDNSGCTSVRKLITSTSRAQAVPRELVGLLM